MHFMKARSRFGSAWRSENTIYNGSEFSIRTDLAPNEPIGAREQIELPMHDTNRGLVVGVPRDLIELAWFKSHVRDLSRSALDAGTEIPVVLENETRSDIVITGVKSDPRYRYTLRAYDIDGVERKAILDALAKTGFNRTAAARLLGITFRQLRYRMQRLNIKDENR